MSDVKNSEAKPRAARLRGIVKWFSREKGYGFLVDDLTRRDVFFHQSSVVEECELKEDEFVSYLPGEERGRKCARQVMRLGHERAHSNR
jgi:cold shock CspA family protein